MSNEFAIAAVTQTLWDLLGDEIVQTVPQGHDPLQSLFLVTKLPLSKLGKSGKNEISLFLFHAALNGAWMNRDLPAAGGRPPLALDLDYLLAIAAEGDDEILAQVMLGQAMRVFHDNAIIPRSRIRMPDSGLSQQIERITITPRPLSIDESTKIWTSLQAPYRVTAAYRATVVLIESRQSAAAPLPILRRGSDDRGPAAATSLPAVLVAARPPQPFTAARLGDTITIDGQNLAGARVEPRIGRTGVNTPIPLQTLTPNRDTFTTTLPNDAAAIDAFAAGVNSFAATVDRSPLPAWPTNEVPLAIAARITVTPTAVALSGDPHQVIFIDVSARPRVRATQDIRLIFGDSQVPPIDGGITPPPHPGDATTIRFQVHPIAGEYLVRLRVDGVDSIPVITDPDTGSLSFDPAQKVTLS